MKTLNFLCLGDVIGRTGRKLLNKELLSLRNEKKIDIIIANGENSAGGLGINEKTYNQLLNAGVDIVTLGNHLWDKKGIYDIIEEKKLIRPLNYPYKTAPGKGVRIYQNLYVDFAVISLLGRVYMPRVPSPFEHITPVLEDLKNKGIKIILIDFHAEATSEKKAMGFHVDGQVSAIFGTHTHVQTNDDYILEGGTGYITDIGMCGDRDSVIGTDKKIILQKFLDSMPKRFEVSANEPMINGIIFSINPQTGKCVKTEKINRVYRRSD
ncbi:MAG: TIGR00282 family metallophosphoesterase [Candidatus Muirbacterium halophilum]|nr:TIGR00282 family metallophosphoesterase [Candidatus Muirbacterium halophilum]MCK9474821.1 TIGR00282 family metallophosphoesterase [Candidatus Muirbacterium halophilum]